MQARQVPFGKEKAFAPQSFLIPEGPSSQQAAGIPKVSRSLGETPPKAEAVPAVTRLLPIPSPRIMQDKSSSVNCATKSSIETFFSRTSRSLKFSV